MTAAARSLFFFGCYMLIVGVSMIFMPNVVLGMIGLPLSQDVWIHLVGLLALFLGIYDIVGARSEAAALIRASVYLRGSVPFVFAIFIAAGLARPPLMTFGIVDMLGAAWTWFALRSTQPNAVARPI